MPACTAMRARLCVLISWLRFFYSSHSLHYCFMLFWRDIRLSHKKLVPVNILLRDKLSWSLCKNDTGTVWCDHSDIYSSRCFNNIVTIYLCKTANHEVHPEISSRPSYSYRTRCEKGTFYDNKFLRLIYYPHCIII